MNPMQGTAVLRFDNGDSFEVIADLRFYTASGRASGHGTIVSDDIERIWSQPGSPVLECDGRRIRVVVQSTSGLNMATILSDGGPL